MGLAAPLIAAAQAVEPAFTESNTLYSQSVKDLNAALKAAIAAPNSKARAKIAERAFQANDGVAARLETLRPIQDIFDGGTEKDQNANALMAALPTERASVIRSFRSVLQDAFTSADQHEDAASHKLIGAFAGAAIEAQTLAMATKVMVAIMPPVSDHAYHRNYASAFAHSFILVQMITEYRQAGHSDVEADVLINQQTAALKGLIQIFISSWTFTDALLNATKFDDDARILNRGTETPAEVRTQMYATRDQIVPHMNAYEAIRLEMAQLQPLTEAALIIGLTQDQSHQVTRLNASIRTSLMVVESLK